MGITSDWYDGHHFVFVEGVLTGIIFSESFEFDSESGDVRTDSPAPFGTFWYGAVI